MVTLFGKKKWLEVIGMDKVDMARRQEMMKMCGNYILHNFYLFISGFSSGSSY